MKKLALLSFVVFFQNYAFAGYGECNKNLNLTCEVRHNFKNGESVFITSSMTPMEDLQPEPFDPADCEGSVVFYTDLGKVVATYSDSRKSLIIWQAVGTKDNVLVRDAQISTEISATGFISTQGQKEYSTLSVTCSLYDNN